jgi:iron complex transport system substrate-binding protein
MMSYRHLLILILVFSDPAPASLVVTDDTNQAVRLDIPATRILTLSPHTTEMLIAIGAEERIIAAAQFFDYPDSLRKIPKINSFGGLDRESVLVHQPDLVLAWASGNHAADIQWLKSANIPVFLSEPKSFADIASSLEKLGILTGKSSAGKSAAQQFLQRIQHACLQREDTPIATVYYEIWHRPPMTIGNRHWLNEILKLAHLSNIFSSVSRGTFSVAAEDLLAKSPEFVITGQLQASRWEGKTKILIASPELGRPGPRIVEGIEALCQQF